MEEAGEPKKLRAQEDDLDQQVVVGNRNVMFIVDRLDRRPEQQKAWVNEVETPGAEAPRGHQEGKPDQDKVTLSAPLRRSWTES